MMNRSSWKGWELHKLAGRVLPAVLLTGLLVLPLMAIAGPVYGQEGGPAATATALAALQQSIYATQTAAAAPPARETGGAAPATSTPAIRQPTATATLRATSTPRTTPTPRATATPRPAAPAAPAATVLVAGLNLRSGPGTGYPILGNAAQGQQLAVSGQAGGCAWLQVQLGDGRTAWTSGGSMYTRLNVPCGELAAVAAPTLAAPAATAAGAAAPRPTNAPQPGAGASPNAPVLVAPESGADHRFSRITFAWKWDGELQPGWGFAVLGWAGDQPPRAIMDARQTAGIKPNSSGLYSIEVGIPQAFSQGSWNWTVAVVQLEPYAQLSGEAAPFLLHVDTRLPTPRPDEDDGADGKNPDENSRRSR